MPTPPRATARTAYITLARLKPFAEGDQVKILRVFEDEEYGTTADAPSKDIQEDRIGETCTVTRVDMNDGTYELDHDDWYPFFVLELVKGSKRVKLNNAYNADISDDGQTVEVGCQTIPAAAVLELAERIRDLQAKAPPKPKPRVPRRRTR